MRFLLALFLGIGIVMAQVPQSDTDGDGLLDTEEDSNTNGIVDEGETNPLDADTDGGGEADGKEKQNSRDPLDRRDDFTYDLDNDGLTNGEEWALGTLDDNPDTDGDGINDSDDPFPLDREFRSDYDGDGLPDEYEATHGLSDEKRSDAHEDNDGDGLTNLEEFVQGTNIDNADTDNDGTTDAEELELGSDPLENPCLLYVGTGNYFADMEEHWAKEVVLLLHRTKVLPSYRRIVDGYDIENATLFLPDREITRFEFLKITLFTSCIPIQSDTENAAITFKDIVNKARPRESSQRKELREIVYTAVAEGIVEGYEDGTFRPDDPVNRAEALKILLKATELEALEEPFEQREFSDVPGGAWFAPYVKRLVEYAIVEGYEDGTFRPEQQITRTEASKILLLTMISNPHVNGYVIPFEETEE
ncbi:hypothetical protein A2454_06150 [Candidatus Peribacteria bacterium RIFOXYC2_FULL_55_14]|nr:MAG: GLUG domain protein [Candidatus Peribacteria bacterium GW2011_GWC2_54_8]OGJ71909.1 MAG: hypothetical protein A2198_03415 [Candidatus Peribacteria bacterium RIFOXYA1_FULL_56_14]OGJ72745.1 MAG: hypothetical protein A2217_04645 [Candidatus Peribacteria bacterium RIFOXYA2_FULL_55_28]OGJ75350.1 MAG: hypothetical protein A2384_00410 [Candidatus Peribacteria bacterium RIFOXYB1_FULL_54_35]OGJ76473.1 MAG: hypothetical protein A2327_01460 [Candidatus Peribacteria bacterium RIFOXYB2_FULL_54_17]OG